METWGCRGKGWRGCGVGALRLPSVTHPHRCPYIATLPVLPNETEVRTAGDVVLAENVRARDEDGFPRASARPPPRRPSAPCPYTATFPFLPNGIDVITRGE